MSDDAGRMAVDLQPEITKRVARFAQRYNLSGSAAYNFVIEAGLDAIDELLARELKKHPKPRMKVARLIVDSVESKQADLKARGKSHSIMDACGDIMKKWPADHGARPKDKKSLKVRYFQCKKLLPRDGTSLANIANYYAAKAVHF